MQRVAMMMTVAGVAVTEVTSDTTTAPVETTASTTSSTAVTTAVTTTVNKVKPQLKGLLEGLLDDSGEIDTCYLDSFSTVLMLAASVVDLQEKKVMDFFTDLSVALGKIEPTYNDCAVVGGKVQHLLAAIKEVNPAKAAANAKKHHSDIMQAIADWSKAKDAEDYETMGKNLGVMLRKVLEDDGEEGVLTIEDETTTSAAIATTTTTTENKLKPQLIGLLEGLLDDSGEMETCEMDGFSTVLMLAAAVVDLQDKKVLDFFTDLSIGLGKIEPTVKDCAVVGGKVQHLLAEIKDVNPAKAVANAKKHHSDIMQAVADWSKAQDTQDYETMGRQLGIMLRKVLEDDGVFV